MSFLYPLFLLGALTVAIPIVLHLLRQDAAPEISFSAVRLLKRSPVEQSKRRRIRDLVLLAARVAGLLLLAASFARPYVSGATAGAALHIIAIDRSFSMAGPDRFARARELARTAIREAGVHDRVAVIAFDDRAELVASAGTRHDAQAALDVVEPGFGTTRYAPVLAKAVEVADGAPARLVVVTDLQEVGWYGEHGVTVPSTLQVALRDVGEPPANLGVVGLRVEAGRALVTLRNTGSARKGRLTAAVADRVLAEVPFELGAASTGEAVFPLRVATGVLRVSVDDPGGLPADDTRYVLLDPAARARVLIVRGTATSGFYLSRALAAVDDDGFEVKALDAKALASLPERELAKHAAIVLLSTRAIDRRTRESLTRFVRRGGGLLIAAGDDLEPSSVAAILGGQPPLTVVEQRGGNAALSATDLRHPIFRPFGVLAANLGQVTFARTWRIREDGWAVAARFTDGGPALLERQLERGRAVLFASDLDRRWNDFPLHPAFVPFAVETLKYLAAPGETPREYLIAQAPAGVDRRPGPVALPPDGRTIIVNVDSSETDPARMSTEAFNRMVQRVQAAPVTVAALRAQQEEGRQSFWQYGLALMLGVLVLESFIAKV